MSYDFFFKKIHFLQLKEEKSFFMLDFCWLITVVQNAWKTNSNDIVMFRKEKRFLTNFPKDCSNGESSKEVAPGQYPGWPGVPGEWEDTDRNLSWSCWFIRHKWDPHVSITTLASASGRRGGHLPWTTGAVVGPSLSLRTTCKENKFSIKGKASLGKEDELSPGSKASRNELSLIYFNNEHRRYTDEWDPASIL